MRSGWEQKRLGEVCSLINRGVAPKYIEAGGVSVLNQKCVRDHEVSFELGRRHDVTAKKVDQERYVRVGDVLVNSTGTGTLGRVAQIRIEPPEPTTVDTHVTIVRPEAGRFYPDFFGYMLIQIEDEIARSGEGASGQTELARATLQNKFVVSFPTSLPEQQRVVAILDGAFAGLATATANAEKNLKNARELFNTHLQNAFDGQREQVQLQTLATEITDGDHSPPPKATSGVPFITISNIVKETREIDFSDTFFVPREYFERLKSSKRPITGDILYTVTGATLGIPVLVRKQLDFCFQRHIGLIRPRQDVDSSWLSYALASPNVYRQATHGSTGAAQKTVSLSVLRNIDVPKQTLAEQRTIASKLDVLFEETQRLGVAYRRKLQSLALLKQSILQKSFSGELTSPLSRVTKEAAE